MSYTKTISSSEEHSKQYIQQQEAEAQAAINMASQNIDRQSEIQRNKIQELTSNLRENQQQDMRILSAEKTNHDKQLQSQQERFRHHMGDEEERMEKVQKEFDVQLNQQRLDHEKAMELRRNEIEKKRLELNQSHTPTIVNNLNSSLASPQSHTSSSPHSPQPQSNPYRANYQQSATRGATGRPTVEPKNNDSCQIS